MNPIPLFLENGWPIIVLAIVFYLALLGPNALSSSREKSVDVTNDLLRLRRDILERHHKLRCDIHRYGLQLECKLDRTRRQLRRRRRPRRYWSRLKN